MHSRAT